MHETCAVWWSQERSKCICELWEAAAIRNQAPRQLELGTCTTGHSEWCTACCSVDGGYAWVVWPRIMVPQSPKWDLSWTPFREASVPEVVTTAQPHQHPLQRAPESHTPWGSAPGPLSRRTGHADSKDGRPLQTSDRRVVPRRLCLARGLAAGLQTVTARPGGWGP